MSDDVDLIDFCNEFANFKGSLSFFCDASSCLLERLLDVLRSLN